MKNKKHWEKIYSEKADNEVSWYQENPTVSIDLMEKYLTIKTDAIIDIGGGNSNLTQHLLNEDYANISVLDISGKALERAKAKIGNQSVWVRWIESDILMFKPKRKYDLWHDRAVFHFLTKSKDIKQYAKIVKDNIAKGGVLILATFAENGPEKCSGLPITQYSESKFCKLFEPDFQLQECFKETHKTPFTSKQNFIWAVFKRV